VETREEDTDTGFNQEEDLEERLYADVIQHREDQIIQFIVPFEEKDLDEDADIEEGPRVDVMVEIPFFQVKPQSSVESSDGEEELSEEFLLEMDPETSQAIPYKKKKNALLWIVFSVVYLFLCVNNWFIWTMPSKEALPLLRTSYFSIGQSVLEDDPVSLEWWEDSSRCEGKIAQQVLFRKSLPSFWVETSEGHGCICGALPIDPLEEPMLMALDGRKFYGCTPEEVFGNP
jgi:hypothetical protein